MEPLKLVSTLSYQLCFPNNWHFIHKTLSPHTLGGQGRAMSLLTINLFYFHRLEVIAFVFFWDGRRPINFTLSLSLALQGWVFPIYFYLKNPCSGIMRWLFVVPHIKPRHCSLTFYLLIISLRSSIPTPLYPPRPKAFPTFCPPISCWEFLDQSSLIFLLLPQIRIRPLFLYSLKITAFV